MEVTIGAVRCAKIQLNCHQTNEHPIFYRLDALPVSPNQQCMKGLRIQHFCWWQNKVRQIRCHWHNYADARYVITTHFLFFVFQCYQVKCNNTENVLHTKKTVHGLFVRSLTALSAQ